MTFSIYTIITFSPVQGFIEKSRKLRDLFGSSFLLSYLAKSICLFAQSKGLTVISPALPDLTQGVSNQIIVQGHLEQSEVYEHFQSVWATVVDTCRRELERRVDGHSYTWNRAWKHWASHCWEFFWAQGETITDARRQMNEVKRSRNWTGINWVGESSTLSGSDAIAWPGMLDRTHPKFCGLSSAELTKQMNEFYKNLSEQWDLAFFDPNERLSIPEMVKRLITHATIVSKLNRATVDELSIAYLKSFQEVNRFEEDRWTGWFQGDGDSIGEYFRSQLSRSPSDSSPDLEAEVLSNFSEALVKWAETFKDSFGKIQPGRIIYAGGDDFLGVMYRGHPDPPLTLQECLENWLYDFSKEWASHGQPITVSVGFVWSHSDVPQRDILQHCKLAEKSAKRHGRDRVAIRILFRGGNHLEWTCPWRLLKPILSAYRDREGRTAQPNWGHLNEDVQSLISRHAFQGDNSRMARELFEIYFPDCLEGEAVLNPESWFNPETNLFDPKHSYQGGILGNQATVKNADQAFNDWFIALARIGHHLFKSSAVTRELQKV